MTDALTGRTLLIAVLAFVLALCAVMALGTYVSQIYSQCETTGVSSFAHDVQRFHSPEGCGMPSTAVAS